MPRRHRDARPAARQVQRTRDGATTHARAAADCHPQRGSGPLGDSRDPLVRSLAGEQCQIVDENSLPPNPIKQKPD